MKGAMTSIGLPVAFTMSSEITSAVFAQVSTYQTEIIIQHRGIKIPIVTSIRDVPIRISEIKQIFACLLREERVVLLFSNNPNGADARGSNTEQMLMETVRYDAITG